MIFYQKSGDLARITLPIGASGGPYGSPSRLFYVARYHRRELPTKNNPSLQRVLNTLTNSKVYDFSNNTTESLAPLFFAQRTLPKLHISYFNLHFSSSDRVTVFCAQYLGICDEVGPR
jgi:hypothetical protein